MVVLLCLTPLFRNMPQNAQAAIIISAVAGLFNVSEAIFLWKVRTSSHAAGRAQGVQQGQKVAQQGLSAVVETVHHLVFIILSLIPCALAFQATM